LYNRTKILALAVLICLPLGLLSLPQGITEEISKEPATFIISSWDYPGDEYGQGISLLRFYENSTGSWVEVYGPTGHYPNASATLDWNASIAIKLRCSSSLNSTFLGLTETIQGVTLQRHNITVTCLGETIFSQQNFTYFSRGQVGPMYYYQYDVVLNFIPQAGMIYIAIITFEVFY